jgi:hypothetical protein
MANHVQGKARADETTHGGYGMAKPIPVRRASMRFAIFAFWILLFGSTQGRAEIVRVRFAGTITQPAPDAPHPFSMGEAIWGSYAYDSLSPPVENSYTGEQYPAIRHFAIESATGFYAQINWATVIINDHPNNASWEGVDQFRVVTLPPLVRVKSPFGDGPNAIPDVEIIETIAYDLESVDEMIAQSQSLGFPDAAGAFLNDSPLWILLSLSSPEWFSSTALPVNVPTVATADQMIGEFHFGSVFARNYPTVKFSISELLIVPEPSAMAMATFAVSSLLRIGRQHFLTRRRTGESPNLSPGILC